MLLLSIQKGKEGTWKLWVPIKVGICKIYPSLPDGGGLNPIIILVVIIIITVIILSGRYLRQFGNKSYVFRLELGIVVYCCELIELNGDIALQMEPDNII